MPKKSILDANGVVVNVVVLEDGAQWSPPEGCYIGPDGGEMGDTWNGTSYDKAPEPPPIVFAN